MKKYYMVINTNTGDTRYMKAESMDHITLYIIKNMTPDWFYGNNIIEVNPDKSRKDRGDFSMNAVRRYFTGTMRTEDDKEILTKEYIFTLNRIKASGAYR